MLEKTLLFATTGSISVNAEEKPTVNAGAGANLVLPLRGHDLGVDTGDVDTGVQAGTVVSLD